MLAPHIASFLKLISAQLEQTSRGLEQTSRGVASPHHLHNVRCGIENILSLLQLNKEIVEKAVTLLTTSHATS
jgi:hypothetical protein